MTDLVNIKKRVDSGLDIFDRPYQYNRIPLNQEFPKYILENKSKFKDWII